MKIDFRKILSQPQKLSIDISKTVFDGNFFKKKDDLVLLNGKLSGEVESICDRCGNDFGLKIDEEIFLKLVNGFVSLQDEEDLDIIECDGVIDFEEILLGEIESIKLDYNYCNKCKNKI